MRFVVALLSWTLIAGAEIAGQTATVTPDALVERGIASYRAGQYANAATDLQAASQALLSQEQMQNYVNTGKFPNLDRFETAIVYLTLAESKLGQKDQAREAVLRLQTAERIEATYAQLSLDPADKAEFESIAPTLVFGFSVKSSAGQVASATPPPAPAASTVAEAAPTKPAVSTTATTTTTTVTTAAPAIVTTPAPAPPRVAETTAPPPPPRPQPAPTVTQSEPTKVAQTSPAPVASTPAQTTTREKLAVAPTLASQRADRQREIEEVAAQQCATIQREADQRIAAIQRAADERVAQAQKVADAQVAAIRAQDRKNYLLSLRQADAMAANGRIDQANDIYNTVVNSIDVPREILAEAAVGLYRTGAFRDAAGAFRKLSPYSRGEEDLRYYNAVSLYETGEYDDAKKELACALPYIQVTADVTRYRQKIENASSRQAAR